MDINKVKNFEKDKQNSKKILVIIVTLIVILIIAAVIIYFYTANAKKKILKVYVNAVNWSMNGENTVVDKKRLSNNSIIKDGNKYYFAIKDFAELAGFNFYRGDRTTEEETKAYIENNSERVTFVSGAKEIRKYYLTSNSSSNKNSNLTSQVFNIDDTILFKNGKLYISESGLGRAFNVLFRYNKESNYIQIYTLEYFYSLMSDQIKDLFKVNSSNASSESKVILDNKKALLYNYVINYDEATGLYGMALLSAPNKLIISKKYKQIDYVEGSDDFIVTTVDGKVGILGKDSYAKVDPKYDSIENIDLNAGLYLVKLYEKYGVVTQMGKIVVSVDYDQIGLDSNIDDKNLTSKYLLYDNCIPVKLLGKWGIFDKNGNKIVNTEYDSVGCYRVQNADGNAQPLVIIPDLNGIVLGKKFEGANKNSQVLYGIVDKTGQMMVNPGAESIYKVVFNNSTTYYYYSNNQSFDIVKAWREEMQKREKGQSSDNTINQNLIQSQNQNINQSTTIQNEQSQKINQGGIVQNEQNDSQVIRNQDIQSNNINNELNNSQNENSTGETATAIVSPTQISNN